MSDKARSRIRKSFEKQERRIDRESKILINANYGISRKFSEQNPPRKINGEHSIYDDAGRVNPLYKAEGLDSSKANCVLCSIAYDARRRDYDVIAKLSSQNIKRSFIERIYHTKILSNNVSGQTFAGVKKEMLSKYPDNSRGILFLQDRSFLLAGHVVGFEIQNRTVMLVDGQNGKVYKFNKRLNLSGYDPTKTTALRTDNKTIDLSFLDKACLEAANDSLEHVLSFILKLEDTVMTYEENQYLIHYGVKGQKHGVRRYQNEDGTLTAEGKERYGGMKNYGANESKGLIRRQAEKGHGMTRAFAEWREGRHKKNLAKAERKGNERKIEKYRSKHDAKSAANSDLKAYRDHSSTAKLLLRSAAYEHARARGTGRLGSMVEAGTPIGGLLRMHRDKKKYGKRIVYSDILENEYDASAMDRD